MKAQDTITPEKALRLRQRVKKKKPDFVRQESWRFRRLKQSWRRPRGLDNKMRRKIKGWPPTVSVGYRGPKVARGLHPSGYREVLVHTVADLVKVNPKTEAIRIAHTVGKRKRTSIIIEARKKKMAILNLKEVKEVAKEELTEEQKKEEKTEEKEETEKTEKAEKPKRKRRKTGKRKGTEEKQ
jgi:large subunit ribosomal protein L32e